MTANTKALESRIEELERQITDLNPAQLMTPRQVCRWLQISEVAFYDMKRRGDGPPTIYYNARLVRYDMQAVREWAEAHCVGS